MAERPSVCASCGKRLGKKQWYYRNGQFYCKPRCWETAKAKVTADAVAAGTAQAAPAASAGGAEAKEANAEKKEATSSSENKEAKEHASQPAAPSKG